MSTDLRELIGIEEASNKYKREVRDILLDALDGNLTLCAIAPAKLREALVPCKEGELHHAAPGEFIHQYMPLLEHIQYVDIELGQVLKIAPAQARELLVKNQFSEVELYRVLAPTLNDLNFDFWKTEREVFDWVNNMDPNDLETRKEIPYDHDDQAIMDFDWSQKIQPYETINIERIFVVESDLQNHKRHQSTPIKTSTENPSNTALKVIGLLMHQLAKSPKFASGAKPNKSQIKELLIELADELGVDPYGLNKVDERILADAMKYLENQTR